MNEYIAIVNIKDCIIGYEEKIKVHQLGILHRAYSIFIFNHKGELLIQRRASNKYHSSDLWSNTCCSHLRSNESMEKAVHRRLKEEMNIECDLFLLDKFAYNTVFDEQLVENEIDYIYFGFSNSEPTININEVSNYKWIDILLLKNEIISYPHKYTYWLKKIIFQFDFPLPQIKYK